jgi:hypothetical protein
MQAASASYILIAEPRQFSVGSISRLQRCEQGIRNLVAGVFVVPDQSYRPRRTASLLCQVRAEGSMVLLDMERPPPGPRLVSGNLTQKPRPHCTYQHHRHPVPEPQRLITFRPRPGGLPHSLAHIVEERRRQEICIGVTVRLQGRKNVQRMPSIIAGHRAEQIQSLHCQKGNDNVLPAKIWPDAGTRSTDELPHTIDGTHLLETE